MQAYCVPSPTSGPASSPASSPSLAAPRPEPEDDLPLTMNARILEAWRDMPASTRRLIAERPSEGRLLFFVILSDVVFFLSWTLKTLLAPTAAAVAAMPGDIGVWLLVAIFLRTACLYILAALAAGACAAAGGRGTWKDTRAAIFWGALVSAPFGLLAAVLGLLLNRGETAFPALSNPLFALPPYYIGLVPFLWFLAAGIATAQKFERVGWTFLALSVATVALSAFGVYLSG